MAFFTLRRLLGAMVLGALCAPLASVVAVAAAPPTGTCLILPFENRSGDANLDWIGESFVAALTESLRSAPATVLNRQERAQALELAGAPAGAALSHATLIRIADAADARWLIVGWYDYDGERFQTGASLFDLRNEHLVPLAPESGTLQDLEGLQNRLGWALGRQLDPDASASPAAAPLPLPAYENYVRAQLATSPQAKLKDLNVAIHLAPRDGRVIFALGEAYLAANDNDNALNWLAQVPSQSPDYPQAEFSAGLAAYRMGQYQRAAGYFSALRVRYPLPAVVDDLALAEARLASPAAAPKQELKTEFSADSLRQLVNAVAQFDDAKQAALPAAERVSFELGEGQRFQKQGGWDAAARDFQAVLASPVPASPEQMGAAHAGLAAVWMERRDLTNAAAEVAAALAADPANAQALALKDELAKEAVIPHA